MRKGDFTTTTSNKSLETNFGRDQLPYLKTKLHYLDISQKKNILSQNAIALPLCPRKHMFPPFNYAGFNYAFDGLVCASLNTIFEIKQTRQSNQKVIIRFSKLARGRQLYISGIGNTFTEIFFFTPKSTSEKSTFVAWNPKQKYFLKMIVLTNFHQKLS